MSSTDDDELTSSYFYTLAKTVPVKQRKLIV